MIIKDVIKAKGFTLNEVAEKLGKSISGMSQIANNDNTPPKTLRQIAKVIGCDITDFFRDEVSTSSNEPQHTHSLTCPKCGAKLSINISIEENS